MFARHNADDNNVTPLISCAGDDGLIADLCFMLDIPCAFLGRAFPSLVTNTVCWRLFLL
jgi:hypothetical protein